MIQDFICFKKTLCASTKELNMGTMLGRGWNVWDFGWLMVFMKLWSPSVWFHSQVKLKEAFLISERSSPLIMWLHLTDKFCVPALMLLQLCNLSQIRECVLILKKISDACLQLSVGQNATAHATINGTLKKKSQLVDDSPVNSKPD